MNFSTRASYRSDDAAAGADALGENWPPNVLTDPTVACPWRWNPA
ncbi:hypothetical protein [Mycobacterium sp. MYCO198283]|nr:hypothetical protein [Mycobacterium sp. MYCO198283]